MDTKSFNESIIAEFRANGGKVGGPFANARVLLLSTRGAKSGLPRTNPLVCLEEGGRLVIFASFAGAPKDPPWFHNLVANPVVGVEVGTERYQARAEVVPEPERTRLYDRMVALSPQFGDYQRKAGRVIPVIALARIA